MLVGDAVDRECCAGYPLAQNLTEQWNLPAGYYHRGNSVLYTTHFYSDILDEEEFSWDTSDLAIKVGLVPVRTLDDLDRVLLKFMNYSPERKTTFRISHNTDNEQERNLFSQIKYEIESINSMNNRNFHIDYTITPHGEQIERVHDALFNTKGVILENAHGFWITRGSCIDMSGVYEEMICSDDAFRFQQLNGAFFTESCEVESYMVGFSLAEAYLIAENGPVITGQRIPLPEFFKRLHNGETIGDVYYDKYTSVYRMNGNPFHLFGDPSLVIYDHMHEQR